MSTTIEERQTGDAKIKLVRKFERWDAIDDHLVYTVDEGCPIDNPIKPPAYEGDIGFDLGAAIQEEKMIILPHGFVNVPTYVRIQLPKQTWGDIRPRSSTFAKRRLIVMGGTIDNGFRGPLSVFIFNPNPTPVEFTRGDYLAQLVIMKSYVPAMKLTDILPDSKRGAKGFGSSGGYASGGPNAD